MSSVFVSHPYRRDPRGNAACVVDIARRHVLEGRLPLAPQIYLPQFIDEATERELALKLCLELVALSDEVRVYGGVSAGMQLEMAEARRLGIPVVDGETGGVLFAKRRPPRRADARAAVKR